EVFNSGKSIIQVLVDFGFLTEEQFYQQIAEHLGADLVDLKAYDPPPDVLRLIPAGLARLHGALPLGLSGDTITVAVTDPLNVQIPEDLRFAIGMNIHIVVAPIYQVDDLLKKSYGADTENMDDILAQLGHEQNVTYSDEGQLDMQSVEAEANAAPI